MHLPRDLELPIDSDIVPSIELYDTSNTCKLGKSTSKGMSPFNWLLFKSRMRNDGNNNDDVISNGIVPDIWLLANVISCNDDRLDISDGIVPDKPLLSNIIEYISLPAHLLPYHTHSFNVLKYLNSLHWLFNMLAEHSNQLYPSYHFMSIRCDGDVDVISPFVAKKNYQLYRCWWRWRSWSIWSSACVMYRISSTFTPPR